jgi:hypothetical protein
VNLVYCDVMSTEHPDNERFLAECERWLKCKVQRIRSERFSSIDDVFERTRYMAGISGARCTAEMKKKPRFAFQQAGDVHIFGMVAEEVKRIENLEHSNPELIFDWILRDRHVSKAQCLQTIEEAGIRLPTMYSLGFKNNNCIGCVKATSIAYWIKIRRHFPEAFERRARQSRELNVRLTRLHGKRIFIDEIPPDAVEEREVEENISCGPECYFGPPRTVAEMRQRLKQEEEDAGREG